MPKNNKTYKTTEILKIASANWWNLDYLVRSGRITALNRVRGQERRFSEDEGLKAIGMLKFGIKPNVKEDSSDEG